MLYASGMATFVSFRLLTALVHSLLLSSLIFMGSEKYPFKGVLDTLANRSFANGTNAWTDTTNTTYTIGTAGAEGFLSILPVFLDHILYPCVPLPSLCLFLCSHALFEVIS